MCCCRRCRQILCIAWVVGRKPFRIPPQLDFQDICWSKLLDSLFLSPFVSRDPTTPVLLAQELLFLSDNEFLLKCPECLRVCLFKLPPTWLILLLLPCTEKTSWPLVLVDGIVECFNISVFMNGEPGRLISLIYMETKKEEKKKDR